MEKLVAATVEPLSNNFSFGEWAINTMKGTIMKSTDAERYQLRSIEISHYIFMLTESTSYNFLIQLLSTSCWHQGASS